MSLQSTQWRATTCPCQFSFDWDDQDVIRVFKVTSVDTRCDRHAQSMVMETHFAQVQEENSRKDKALARLEEVFPQLFDLAGNGDFLGAWLYDPGNTLRFRLNGLGLTQLQKNQFIGWCNSNLGMNSVALD